MNIINDIIKVDVGDVERAVIALSTKRDRSLVVDLVYQDGQDFLSVAYTNGSSVLYMHLAMAERLYLAVKDDALARSGLEQKLVDWYSREEVFERRKGRIV